MPSISLRTLLKGIWALAETESRLQEIAATIQQLVFVRDADNQQFLYVSSAYEKLWGQPVEALYQQPDLWMQTVHPDDLLVVQQSLHDQNNGKPTVREFRIIRADGHTRWIRTQATPVFDEVGRLSRVIGIGDDITERKQIELDMQRLNEQLQRLATVDDLTGLANRRHLQKISQTTRCQPRN